MSKAVFILLFLFLGLICVDIHGYDDTPKCFRSLETGFFDQATINQALDMHRVAQNTWIPIYQELKRRSYKVPRQLRDEARKMKPNPFDNPFDFVEAEKLLLKVLRQAFSETLQQYLVTNRSDIDQMFNYIYTHKKKEIEACFKSIKPKRVKEVPEPQQPEGREALPVDAQQQQHQIPQQPQPQRISPSRQQQVSQQRKESSSRQMQEQSQPSGTPSQIYQYQAPPPKGGATPK